MKSTVYPPLTWAKGGFIWFNHRLLTARIVWLCGWITQPDQFIVGSFPFAQIFDHILAWNLKTALAKKLLTAWSNIIRL